MLQRWKRAVVHLECAADSVHFYDRLKTWTGLQEKLRTGEIGAEEMAKNLSEGSRDIRYNGTAIFFKHEKRRFLLTARHVLWDEDSALRELEEEKQRLESWPEHARHGLEASARERAALRVFSIIFRVPTLDEALSASLGEPETFLMNLGAGVTFLAPYTFSNPDVDLAIISLDQRDSRFADELELRGYEPITPTDVGEPSSEGADVFTVGYPSATAILGRRPISPGLAHWSSAAVSQPVFVFGKIAMLHGSLHFFW